MSKKLYEETNIEAIASAIRSKNGSSDTYTVSEMSSAINAISSLLGKKVVSKNGIYLPENDDLDGYNEVDVNITSVINVISGLDAPNANIGSNRDIYLKIKKIYPEEYFVSEDGWYAPKENVKSDTTFIGNVGSVYFSKLNASSTLAAFLSGNVSNNKPYLASTNSGATSYQSCNQYYASVTGRYYSNYSYEIGGVLWYFNSSGPSYWTGEATSNFPKLESIDFSTREGAEAFLELMGVGLTELITEYIVETIYMKNNGNWTLLKGSDIGILNMDIAAQISGVD